VSGAGNVYAIQARLRHCIGLEFRGSTQHHHNLIDTDPISEKSCRFRGKSFDLPNFGVAVSDEEPRALLWGWPADRLKVEQAGAEFTITIQAGALDGLPVGGVRLIRFCSPTKFELANIKHEAGDYLQTSYEFAAGDKETADWVEGKLEAGDAFYSLWHNHGGVTTGAHRSDFVHAISTDWMAHSGVMKLEAPGDSVSLFFSPLQGLTSGPDRKLVFKLRNIRVRQLSNRDGERTAPAASKKGRQGGQ